MNITILFNPTRINPTGKIDRLRSTSSRGCRAASDFRGIFLLMLTLSGPGAAMAAEPFLPDKQEILMMPKLCRWMYGPRVGLDPSLTPPGPMIDVTGCTRFHYYCDANTDLVRAEKAMYFNLGRAKEKLASAINTLKGQVTFHSEEPCSKYLQSDINYTLGYALSLMSKVAKSSSFNIEAIQPLNKAIELNPEDLRPYRVLADIYMAIGKRNLAEKVIYSGLELNPQSKPLLRLYKEVGGTRPLPSKKIVTPATPQAEAKKENQADGDGVPTGHTETKPGGVDIVPPVVVNPIISPPQRQIEGQTTDDVQNKEKKYCRFCVEE
jgi:hypothetical protein